VRLASPLPLGSFRVSSPYGFRINPVTGAQQLHNGIDLAAPTGTPVYAVAPGTVRVSSYGDVNGNWIQVDHGGGVATAYLHLQARYATPGQVVAAGQQIGTVGSTGRSTGPHLHFMVYLNGSAVDPGPRISWSTAGNTALRVGRAGAVAWSVVATLSVVGAGSYALWHVLRGR
jgi:murein DD-endopeptidase MepM/ murein hydrolase activator NlpD